MFRPWNALVGLYMVLRREAAALTRSDNVFRVFGLQLRQGCDMCADQAPNRYVAPRAIELFLGGGILALWLFIYPFCAFLSSAVVDLGDEVVASKLVR